MALDATVKGTSANSYLTEVDATAYLTNERLYVTAWTSATTQVREQALIWATFLIDNSFEFLGTKTTIAQALRWPRIGVLDADGNDLNYHTIPVLVNKATATLALSLITSNRIVEPSIIGLGIAEARVGPIRVKIDEGSAKDLIPDEVKLILATLGTLKSAASNQSASVPLLRG